MGRKNVKEKRDRELRLEPKGRMSFSRNKRQKPILEVLLDIRGQGEGAVSILKDKMRQRR